MIKVHDKASGAAAEVSAAEAQRGLEAGQYVLTDQRVRMARADREFGQVRAENVGKALADGFRLIDPDEHAKLKIAKEEDTLASNVLGTVESAAAGATLGLSTEALTGDPTARKILLSLPSGGLGAGLATEAASGIRVDPERMSARRENLGGVATAAEIAGAIAPAPFTGGATLEGLAARAGGRTGLRGLLSYSPAGLLEGLGSLAGKGTAKALQRAPGWAKSVVPLAAREGVTGIGYGIGQEVHESALGDRELTAEHLMSSGAIGGLFGVGGGAGFGGLGRLASGLGRAEPKALQQVLGRSTGVGKTSRVIADHVDSVARLQAKATGGDSEAYVRAWKKVFSDPAEVSSVLTNRKKIDNEIAEVFQTRFTSARRNWDETLQMTSGAQKYKNISQHVPRHADDIAPRIAVKAKEEVDGVIEGMLRENADAMRFDPAARMYTPNALLKAKGIMGRASKEMLDLSTAAGVHQALNRAKQDLGLLIGDTGGWGKLARDATLDVKATNAKLRDTYRRLQTHLEDTAVYGKAGEIQSEGNALLSRARRLEDDFRKRTAKGSGASSLFTDTGEVSLRQAYTLARQYSRIGGTDVVNKLDEVFQAQLDYADFARKMYKLDEVQLSTLGRHAEDITEIRRELKKQSKRASLLDDFERMREGESARSVSMGVLSSLGPTVGGAVGFGVGGPLGAAAGMVLGSVTRPYTTARTLAGILSMANKAGLDLNHSIGRFTTSLKPGKKVPPPRASAITSKLTHKERKERSDKVRTAVASFTTDPSALARAIGTDFHDLDEAAPGVAAATRGKLRTAAVFLASKVPPAYKPAYGAPIVDWVSQDRFDRYVEAAMSPTDAIDRAAEGTLTAEHAEALRAVYPEIYAELQRQTMEAVAEGEIPFRKRSMLGVLLDIPADPSLLPPAPAQVLDSQPQQPPAQPKVRPAELETSAATTTLSHLETGGMRNG